MTSNAMALLLLLLMMTTNSVRAALVQGSVAAQLLRAGPPNIQYNADCVVDQLYEGPSCDTFFVCMDGRTFNQQLVLFSCGHGTMYDSERSVCVHALPLRCPNGPDRPTEQTENSFTSRPTPDGTSTPPTSASQATSSTSLLSTNRASPSTPIPTGPTSISSTSTPIPPSPTSNPSPSTPIPTGPTIILSPSTPIPPSPTNSPSPSTPIPTGPTSIPSPSTAIPPSPTSSPSPSSPVPPSLTSGPNLSTPNPPSPTSRPSSPSPPSPTTRPSSPSPPSPTTRPSPPSLTTRPSLPSSTTRPSPPSPTTRPSPPGPPPFEPASRPPSPPGFQPSKPSPPSIPITPFKPTKPSKPLKPSTPFKPTKPSKPSKPSRPGGLLGSSFKPGKRPRPLLSILTLGLVDTDPQGSSACPQYSLDPTSIVNCTREGRWEHPGDCNRFYQCILTMDCILKGFLFRCPEDYHFIKSSGRCKALLRPKPCHKFSDAPAYGSFTYPVIQLEEESINQFQQASAYWDYMPFLSDQK